VGEVEAKIHLVFWRKNDCLFFWFSVEIPGGSAWYPLWCISCVSMGPYGALHAPKTRIWLSSGTYSYVCSNLRYQAGGVWNLITELVPCWVFDLKSKIVFSSLRVGYVSSGCSPEAFQRICSVAWAQLELATPPKTYLWFHQLPLPLARFITLVMWGPGSGSPSLFFMERGCVTKKRLGCGTE